MRWTPLLWALGCASEPEPAVAPSPPAAAAVAPEGAPRHLVFIVVDTLRADEALAAATPVMDQLAAEGDRVERAWSSGTWTVPSVMSLFLGQSVRQHGWNFSFPRDQPDGKETRFPPMPATSPTLAEVLQGAGFQTQGLYANTTLRWKLGFDRGFQSWERCGDRKMPQCVAALTANWKRDERHFLYVHFLGPHQPVQPSGEARRRHGLDGQHFRKRGGFFMRKAERGDAALQETYRKGYRAVVEDTDQRIGRVLEALGPFRADTMVVLTSDHGDLLGEKDQWGHWHFVWEELTHVPLIVTRAGDLPPAMRTDTLADLVTRTLGVEHTWPSRADAPLPLVAQREGRIAFSADGRWKGIWGEEEPQAAGVRTMRLAEPKQPDTGAAPDPTRPAPPTEAAPVDSAVLVYDLEADPREATVLRDQAERLRAERAAWEAATTPGVLGDERVAAPEDAMEELRALGYVE